LSTRPSLHNKGQRIETCYLASERFSTLTGHDQQSLRFTINERLPLLNVTGGF
jgi:hypothetical protein